MLELPNFVNLFQSPQIQKEKPRHLLKNSKKVFLKSWQMSQENTYVGVF